MSDQVTVSLDPRPYTVQVLPEPMVLDASSQAIVTNRWQECLAERPFLFDGPTLALDPERLDGGHTLVASVSRYSHYLASRAGALPARHAHRQIYVSILVETSQGHFVLGVMAPTTAAPGVVQLPGGGLTPGDAVSGWVDVTAAASRELSEEVGVSGELRPFGIIREGVNGGIGLLFLLRTPVNDHGVAHVHRELVSTQAGKGEASELADLLFIDPTQPFSTVREQLGQRPQAGYIAPLVNLLCADPRVGQHQ
jgi:8-oxo-dGTP pyrophosphatase MutT (NUDIX family)